VVVLPVGSLVTVGSVPGPTLVASVASEVPSVAVVSSPEVVCAATGPQAATSERRPRDMRKSDIRRPA
jgi:hypothetical protein